ncbi:MAG TPA: hypothetical protein VIM58_10265 [Candidatus Methylacidiphilales bacterium]
MNSRPLVLAALGAAALLAAGCSEDKNVRYVDPNAQGTVASTGIESQDINAAALQAAQSIVNVPEIAHALTPPVIIITPVVNKSSSPIDTSLYTSILRDTLLNNSGGKVRFLDRTNAAFNEKEQEMANAGSVQGRGDRDAMSYDYILTAELQGIGMASAEGQSDYFRISFKLIARKTDLLIWSNPYQIKKEGKESAVYR